MKIGIFGGSFNPPHNMHTEIAESLLKNNYLDKIILVPTSNFYPKADLIDDKDRIAMLNILSAKNKSISVSDYEFGRLTYTYETLEHFQKLYPQSEIYFICGSDNLKEMDTWKAYELILSNFKVLVVNRNENINKILEKYSKYLKNIIITNIEEQKVSSTMLRKYLKENNHKLIKDLIDPDVLEYIHKHNLYKNN